MDKIISEALKLGLWQQLDIQFAHMLINDPSSQHALMLSIIVLSAYVRQGHICLPLSMLVPDQLFFGLHTMLANQACEKSGNLSSDDWEKLLLSFHSIVGIGLCITPLVIDKKRLYLYRMWKNECLVANFFNCASQQLLSISKEKMYQVARLLDCFFPIVSKSKNDECIKKSNKNINWQKVAVAMVFVRRMIVISGGPGTGKTSMISKLLIILALLNNVKEVPLIVRMATPTGKSAARLNENIRVMVEKFNVSYCYKNFCFSVQAVTLHRLLGIYFNKKDAKCTRNNFLNLDYLIIDESSMIDLCMMVKIITVLPSRTTVIFLGDHKQLASVEPGSIFSDICYFIEKGYTLKFCEQLRNLTNYILPINRRKIRYNISDSVCLLKKNYRFSSSSGIGKLAYAISSGDRQMVLSLLTANSDNNINYIAWKNNSDYFDMLVSCTQRYADYFKNILCCNYTNLSYILNIFNRYRVLCVSREGPFGVIRLNNFFENILNHHGFIQLRDGCQNYVGRPIIITSNSQSLSLFNGEVGVVLPDGNMDNSRLFAYFLSSESTVKKVSLHELPKHETSFAMTIHKSQGSEFQNISLIFPNKIIPMLSRELLYTGVTRARKCLSVYATDQVVNYSMNHKCKRYSGLIDKLKELQ